VFPVPRPKHCVLLLGRSRNERVAQFDTVALVICAQKIARAPIRIGIYWNADQCAK